MDDKCDKFIDELEALYDVHSADLEENSPELLPLFSELTPEPPRYTDEELIARGGMKDISKVFDPKTGRHIALAKLHADSPEELYEPFLREARLTALLDHPNIITIYDIGLDSESVPFFTMELKTGKSLAPVNMKDEIGNRNKEQDTGDFTGGSSFILHNSYFKEKSPEKNIESIHGLMEIFLKVCDAIAYSHSRNVLHLDLKPENIQVGHFGEVLVCDWGLGKVVGDNDYDGGDFDRLLLNQDLLNNMTLSGEIKGTPGYMAPEQIISGGAKTVQTDIYALGALLYTMLTNSIPVAASSSVDIILEKTAAGDIESPEKRFPQLNIPEALSSVAMKALALKPNERYPSVEALRNDVHSYLSGYSTSAQNASLFTELKLVYKRNRSICRMAVVFLLILIGVSGWFIININQSRLSAEQAQKRSEFMRDRAEETLKMYEIEQNKIIQLNNERSHELEEDTKAYRYHFFFDDPPKYINKTLMRLNKAIALNPLNKRAIGLKGHQYFVMQDFDTALKIFEQSDLMQEDLHKICYEVINEPKNQQKLISTEVLTRIIRSLPKKHKKRFHLCERLVAYDMLLRKDFAGYPKVIEALLQVWNKTEHQSFTFNYNLTSKSLALHGSGLKILQADSAVGSGKSLIRFLDIETLDISETKVYDLNQISELIHLKKLDIRDTLITNLTPLKNLPALQTLVIKEGQFDSKALKSVPKKLSITVIR